MPSINSLSLPILEEPGQTGIGSLVPLSPSLMRTEEEWQRLARLASEAAADAERMAGVAESRHDVLAAALFHEAAEWRAKAARRFLTEVRHC